MVTKNTQRLLSLIAIFLLSSLQIHAAGSPLKQVVVIGKVIGGLTSQYNQINVQTYGIEQFGSTRFSISVSGNGEFNFPVQIRDEVAVIRLSLTGNLKIFAHKFVEAGDTLWIEVDATTDPALAKFHGPTAVKFECEDNLNKQYAAFLATRRGKFRTDFNNAYQNREFQLIHMFYLKGYLQMIDSLESYKNQISAKTYAYYKATFSRSYLGIWEAQIKNALRDDNSDDLNSKVANEYQKYQYPAYSIDENVASLNIEYLRLLIEKGQNHLLFKSYGKGYTLPAIYRHLKSEYTGILRDRLLTFFLKSPFALTGVIDYQPQQMDSLLTDAYASVADPALRKLLVVPAQLVKGSPAFEFSLPDTAGKMVKLSDFRRKVVLIDVWGEGCTGCAMFFAKFEKEVLPKLSNKNDFANISINVNKTRKGWLRGIKSGLYTNEHNINLHTEGKALDHPFAKFYNMVSVPFILLVGKDGRVFSKLDISLQSSEVLKLIEAALAE